MQKVTMQVLTPKRLLSREDGAEIIDIISRIYPNLMPERYGNFEPFRLIYKADEIEKFLDHWHHMIFWTRKRPRVEGSVATSDSKLTRHGWLSIDVDISTVEVNTLVDLLKNSSSRLAADFGFIHLLCGKDIETGRMNGTVAPVGRQRDHYSLLLTGHKLEKNIPDLYWATILGDPYVRHFGRERLLTIPAPIVEELPNGCFYLQLSESLFDLNDDFDAVDKVRQAVKAHLNLNSFFDPKLAPDHVYNVPEFQLEPLPATKA